MHRLATATIVLLLFMAGCLGASDGDEQNMDAPGSGHEPSDIPSRPIGDTNATAPASLPSPCVGPEVPATTRTWMPTASMHCIEPEFFTVDGRSLGFLDDPGIDWIRPGINLIISEDHLLEPVGTSYGCTGSFLLTNSTGAFFLLTAAHCVSDDATVSGPGAPTRCTGTSWPLGEAIEIQGYDEPGSLYWTAHHHMKEYGGSERECESWDHAIVEIPSSLHEFVHPAIRHIGGPVGLADPLDLEQGDAIVGYGNSDSRGFLVEAATGEDHGSLPVWPLLNVFRGSFVGNFYDELPPETPTQSDCARHWSQEPYCAGYKAYIRYAPAPKISGDSGSADLTADGFAIGATSALSSIGHMATAVLYDALLRFWLDTGDPMFLVIWDEWSPDTIET